MTCIATVYSRDNSRIFPEFQKQQQRLPTSSIFVVEDSMTLIYGYLKRPDGGRIEHWRKTETKISQEKKGRRNRDNAGDHDHKNTQFSKSTSFILAMSFIIALFFTKTSHSEEIIE